MQIASFRYLVLTFIVASGAALALLIGGPAAPGAPRWPEAEEVYGVDRWSVGPLHVERANGTDVLTRLYTHPTGATATFALLTNQQPKLYSAGADVPFLGGGYVVGPAPADLGLPDHAEIGALTAERGGDQWLVLYGYGERRGLLGNGVLPWTLALADGLLGRQNDYYKLYLTVPTRDANPRLPAEAAELASVLFAQVAAWYGS